MQNNNYIIYDVEMKPDEAIDYLQDPIGKRDKHDDAINMAINALKKQIPKEPYKNIVEYPHMPDMLVVQCPVCKRRLRTKRTMAKGDRYCPDCGHAILWNSEDSEEQFIEEARQGSFLGDIQN